LSTFIAAVLLFAGLVFGEGEEGGGGDEEGGGAFLVCCGGDVG